MLFYLFFHLIIAILTTRRNPCTPFHVYRYIFPSCFSPYLVLSRPDEPRIMANVYHEETYLREILSKTSIVWLPPRTVSSNNRLIHTLAMIMHGNVVTQWASLYIFFLYACFDHFILFIMPLRPPGEE